jgi:hypothetical protein
MAVAMVLAPLAGWAAQEAPLAWMVGDWKEDVAGNWTTEHWQPAQDGVMRGSGASGHDQVVKNRETTSIAFKEGKAVYTASPDGAAPTDFTELSRGASEIVFANDAHDYPQRVRYWREGDTLMAEISLKDGSKAMRWRYRRVN